jgi:acyl-CoA synthetase (AMP-forming)/AMP-acid ligase II
MTTLSLWTCHTPEQAAAYRAAGHWRNRNLVSIIDEEIATDPDRIIVFDQDHALTIGDLSRRGRALAHWLGSKGVKTGEVVSAQLPNWWEMLVIDVATSMIGAVFNPIIPIYRDAEVGFILKDSRSRIMFVAPNFRGFDFTAMMSRLRPGLPDLLDVVEVRGTNPDRFASLLQSPPLQDLVDASPDSPRLLMYTSGTTAQPKGVLHSYNTLDCEIRNAATFWRLQRTDVVYMPSPLTHITGYLYGMGFPVTMGMTAVLSDRWDAEAAIDVINRHQANAMVAATPFLQELATVARVRGDRLPSLRLFACGGAPVAPEIVRNATQAFENCIVCRVYGSTEAPTVTLGDTRRGSDIAATTDGKIYGYVVKVCDEAGKPVEPGHPGEIVVRGPELMLGYLHEDDTRRSLDADGYFRTGDLGRIIDSDVLIITGREKDLIIRGGENLSAKEIEDILYEFPGVREVAIVGMPHARLGETVCAFVVTGQDARPNVADLCEHISTSGLARQKIPEHFEFVEALPKTASGKIQKFLLRETARAFATK